jgi:hypothetical protein
MLSEGLRIVFETIYLVRCNTLILTIYVYDLIGGPDELMSDCFVIRFEAFFMHYPWAKDMKTFSELGPN